MIRPIAGSSHTSQPLAMRVRVAQSRASKKA